ncbi:hypothetical protein BLS_004250 [Venturia inaequalis]|uniref:Uncharacterized protein n=1 Tax=Venturia inaequalis TaxID=5025 RepID=A0A8H3V5E3_VENIN|nr:hypothetical protein EG327_006060 [Venturia inaequalis]KAE9983477.1 hypothetical protein BLS_004250 [Venturia inaequalis]
MTPHSSSVQAQAQPSATEENQADEPRPTTSQDQATAEFYLHLSELKNLTANPSWSTNPQILLDMKAKLVDVNESFDELCWLSRREIVKGEIEAYLPQLDGFIHDHALGIRPSQIVSRILAEGDTQAGGDDEVDWHTQHDHDLIFKTWDEMQPLLKSLESGWLKYLPRANSPTHLTKPPTTSEVTFTHPEGLAVAMRNGCWLQYKGDLYKASLSHFFDGHGGIEEAKRDVRKAKAVLAECEGGVRKGDSRVVVDVLFGAEKKFLSETGGFLREEGGGSPW